MSTNAIPSHWRQCTLGEIARAKPNNGVFRKNAEYLLMQSEGVPVVWVEELFRGTSIDTGTSRRLAATNAEIDKYGLKKGDILFCRSSLKLDGIAFNNVYLGEDDRALFECHIIRVSPRLDTVWPEFLNWQLRTPTSRAVAKSKSKTATMTTIDQESLSSFPIVLPPLSEQRRIAGILDRAESLRAKRRAALAKLDTLTQAIFIDMFGDPVTNPKGWPKHAFGKVCESRLGKMLDQKQQTGQHRRPYLRNANVQWFRFDLTEVFEMDFDEDDRNEFNLKDGDLLICEGGEPGRAAIWHGEIEECYFQKAVHRARPNSQLANPDYLAWLLWFLAQRGGLGDHVTSATIAHLTGEKLKAMMIPVPPLGLQKEFARRAAAVEQLRSSHRASLAQVDALFASLQHRAFRGEL